MKTYAGSCHCGAVRFETEIDLTSGTSRCNCSICTKSRFWKAIAPDASFRLVQGSDALSSYRFGSGTIEHMFCRHCGVKVFGRGRIETIGPFHAVSVACLDDVDPAELIEAPLSYEDGRHDAWDSVPNETRHL